MDRISAYLVAGALDHAPSRLSENAAKAFQGSTVLGAGFTFDDAAAEQDEAEPIARMKQLQKNSANAGRIKPYIGGEEVNNSPSHAFYRYVIDFEEFPLRRDTTATPRWSELTEKERSACLRTGIVPADYLEPVAEDWPELLEIIDRRVRPVRSGNSRERYAKIWWQHAERRPGLYRAIARRARVIVNSSKASPHHALTFLPANFIFTQNLNVFALDRFCSLCVLQSRAHELWARFVGTTMKDDFTYAKEDCFETFPFPLNYESNPTLETAGQSYHDHRAALMVAANEGMTKTYNRFHDADEGSDAIARLRELHDAMDRAVLRAYGWDDLADELRPVFLTEETEDDHTYQGRYFWPAEARDRVLARLLALNAERHAEELAAGRASTTVNSKAERDVDDAQDNLDLE
ncbi:type IIL restriction-modification enzyme MmeI [Bradyrhizobium sp. SZCCHNR1075]|uniref:type IIL restriction-modification enzyme MmeI n=1 Tax=Bradyrhizobium sp. SZCCHNR1075 TaxID=3057362 RepID=UPI0028EC6E79|nr:type IIL restriction-modification enzyme MmeI [Bradyrhizobium sp. SZCCHNR1075]